MSVRALFTTGAALVIIATLVAGLSTSLDGARSFYLNDSAMAAFILSLTVGLLMITVATWMSGCPTFLKLVVTTVLVFFTSGLVVFAVFG